MDVLRRVRLEIRRALINTRLIPPDDPPRRTSDEIVEARRKLREADVRLYLIERSLREREREREREKDEDRR